MLCQSLILLSSLVLSLGAPIDPGSSIELDPSNPTVQIINGTIQGINLPTYNQDAFLGIPFAEPPLGPLRFASPVPYNHSWVGENPKAFQEYGYACIASTATDSSVFPQGEDCLTLNVIRPKGYENAALPVGIWIYGGAFQDGTSRNPANNLSFIVENSVEIGKPIIGVSLNYRLGGFGWLGSQELVNLGYTNVGLRDQIQAIKWVHENIQAFGGDPNHLVLWGESAGAISISKILSSNQLSEEYIKGAIIESGPILFPNTTSGATPARQNDYDLLVDHFNCSDEVDTLECLQNADTWELQYAFNGTNGVLSSALYYPYIDGEIISKSGYQTLLHGNFLKVPVLIGTNTDEGTSFVMPGLNSSLEFMVYLKFALPTLTMDTIIELGALYPEGDPLVSAPLDPTYNTTPIVYPEGVVGSQFPRLATLFGDVVFIGGSRITARFYAEHSPVYKYRFNIQDLQYANSNLSYIGAGHGQEVVYVFDNNQAPEDTDYGATWNPDPRSAEVAKRMSNMWVNFISELNPNINDVDTEVPAWPEYNDAAQQYVFDLNGFYVETDDARAEQINYIESIMPQLNA